MTLESIAVKDCTFNSKILTGPFPAIYSISLGVTCHQFCDKVDFFHLVILFLLAISCWTSICAPMTSQSL